MRARAVRLAGDREEFGVLPVDAAVSATAFVKFCVVIQRADFIHGVSVLRGVSFASRRVVNATFEATASVTVDAEEVGWRISNRTRAGLRFLVGTRFTGVAASRVVVATCFVVDTFGTVDNIASAEVVGTRVGSVVVADSGVVITGRRRRRLASNTATAGGVPLSVTVASEFAVASTRLAGTGSRVNPVATVGTVTLVASGGTDITLVGRSTPASTVAVVHEDAVESRTHGGAMAAAEGDSDPDIIILFLDVAGDRNGRGNTSLEIHATADAVYKILNVGYTGEASTGTAAGGSTPWEDPRHRFG